MEGTLSPCLKAVKFVRCVHHMKENNCLSYLIHGCDVIKGPSFFRDHEGGKRFVDVFIIDLSCATSLLPSNLFVQNVNRIFFIRKTFLNTKTLQWYN